MVHSVGDETRCRIGVAIAALNRRCRDMRRRGHARRRCAVVTANAIVIARLMDIDTACPT